MAVEKSDIKKSDTSDKSKNNNGNGKSKASKPEDVPILTQEMKDWKHLQGIIRHVDNVRTGAKLLGEHMFEQGDMDMARLLVQKVSSHDASKFVGVEWEHLRPGCDTSEEFKMALKQHQLTNDHHPEHWGGVKNMPNICLAEMVCDFYARSIEFGTDLRAYIKDGFMPKHNFTSKTKVYQQIKKFVDLILEEPFK
jgi:hypothetical protein